MQKLNISLLIENQIPKNLRENSPLLIDFLRQYYISAESTGKPLDILENIDSYIKLDNVTNINSTTKLKENISFNDKNIKVESTLGFPDKYGLIKINDEIISYEFKDGDTFINCFRGFSGVDSYSSNDLDKDVVFNRTNASDHFTQDDVENLSILFLKEFLFKIKKQFSPGFEEKRFTDNINENIFIKQSKDFYSSKGTISSFEILFRSLYGERVLVINPNDFVLKSSDSNYLVTKDLVVEPIIGNPEDLLNQTLYQLDDEYFSEASSPITKVEKILRNLKEYYIISLDFDNNNDIEARGSIVGNFEIHPKTKIIGNVRQDQTIIDVDSTIGFPNSGTLVIQKGIEELKIKYGSKTLNQFLDCKNVPNILNATEIRLDTYAYGISSVTGEEVRVRIGGVLSDLNIDGETYLSEKNDTIKIISPGKIVDNIQTNNWIYNLPISYNLKEPPIPETVNSQKITTIDENSFVIGDRVIIQPSSGTQSFSSTVLSILDKNTFIITPQVPSDPSLSYSVRRNLSKGNFLNYPEINGVNANIQNVYSDKDSSIYITSPSIPNYLNNLLRIDDRSVLINGFQTNSQIFMRSHPFLTGDLVFYSYENSSNNLGIPEGAYVVKRINQNFISLFKNSDDLFFNKIVEFEEKEVINNRISFLNLYNKKLRSQKLIRKISTPESSDIKVSTSPGYTGIFNNGVEILNYKSSDYVYYGQIEKVLPLNDVSGYDITSPNTIKIKDSVGAGASVLMHVTGNLKEINVIDGGFDYINLPSIKISGGNGVGAIAKPSLVTFTHTVDFNSGSKFSVDVDNNIISTPISHKFRSTEKVIYKSNGNLSIGGLIDDSIYYLKSISSTEIKLFNTISDAISEVNELNLTSLGRGIHSLTSVEKKKRIGSIKVEKSGTNYSNKKIILEPKDIKVEKNTILAVNHGYKDKEIISYSGTGSPIGGLQFGNYYIKYINNDEFSLVRINTEDNIPNDFDFNSNNIVKFNDSGLGNHIFNYPNIIVSVDGIVGVNTFSLSESYSIIQPIFSGKIENIFIVSGGEKYGSNNIINYEKQPDYEIIEGSGCILSATVLNGKIEKVLILNSGRNYNSPPELKVIGSGVGAKLVPIIEDGRVTEVKVISKGIGYLKKNTQILVKNRTEGKSRLKFKIKSWNIDNYFRFQNLLENNAILSNPINSDFEIQYSHLALPDNLRRISIISKIFEDTRIVINDKENDTISQELRIHSPILGWAYDGNPIYGPYGFDTPRGGTVRRMISGYQRRLKLNRPEFPFGIFVEDYSFIGTGDLDENNGRFCITPEFPNGTYAYFCTIDSEFRPQFPYVIGNFYESSPIKFNFDKKSNQDEIKIEKTNWVRNTKQYNFTLKDTFYEYIDNPNEIKNQDSKVLSVSSGTVDSIDIKSSGLGYKVGDKIIISATEDDSGVGASAEVSRVGGKTIRLVNTDVNIIDNVQIATLNNVGSTIGISSDPHGLTTEDFITFSNTLKIPSNEFYKVRVVPTELILRERLGTELETGITTYMSVYGDLRYPNVIPDDIFSIGNEKIKVLLVDNENKRLKILRGIDSSLIEEHFENKKIIEIPRKLYFDIDLDKNYRIDRKYYFDPKETVGIGTTFGIGIGFTVTFSNPGIGVSQTFIPTRSLLIKNHNLRTGTKLIYNTNSGIGLSVSNDGNTNLYTLEDNTIVYAAKISDDLIGISTAKVRISSDGDFINEDNNSILFFNSLGSGENHSFKTVFDDTLTTTINNISSLIETEEDHFLEDEDKIALNVTPDEIQTYNIFYDSVSKNLCFDKKEIVSIENNVITLISHGYTSGQKILFTSSNPPIGLFNGKKYYVIVINENQIKLSNTFNGALNNINIVHIDENTTDPDNFISLVNPPISVYRNNTLVFDLSDPSLIGFDFDLFTNKNLTNKFFGDTPFDLVKLGVVGESGSQLILRVNSNTKNIIYYGLSIIDKSNITLEKQDYFVDNNNIKNNNTIFFMLSKYSSEYNITRVDSTKFKINLNKIPEKISYNNTNNILNYTTTSKNTSGPISSIALTSKGKNYKKLPIIKKINSESGRNALLELNSKSIGKILNIKINDIGFDYFSDPTIRPSAKIPEILKVNPLASLDEIIVESFGINYNISPNLFLVDGLTNKIIPDVILNFSLGNDKVEIVKNTRGINNITPIIIPTSNSNGIRIFDITFNSIENEITLFLDDEYSTIEEFPFIVGDNVLIEKTNVLENTGRSYNSIDYDFKLFPVKQINPQLGGQNPSIILDSSGFIRSGQSFGIFDDQNSFGLVVPEKYFPKFKINLKKNDFFIGEKIVSGDVEGIVEKYDPINELLKISTTQSFKINSNIVGKTSNSIGKVVNKFSFESDYSVKSKSIVTRSWQDFLGFLNTDLQKVHDNFYYQFFSYSLKSRVQFNEWESSVSSLNHTSGFKKFSNLDVEVISPYSGIQTSQGFGNVNELVNLDSVIDITCKNDYDLVSENNNLFNSVLASNKINFESRELFDFFNCIGNRVLSVDDISSQFRTVDRRNVVSSFSV